MQGNAIDATNLKNSIAIEPSNRIIAEINQNRYNNFDQDYVDDNESTYYGVNSVNDEFLNETFYKETFPISSVVNPIRPQQTGFSFFRQLPEDSSKRPYNVIRSVSSMNAYNTDFHLGVQNLEAAKYPPPQYISTNTDYTPAPRLYYPGSGIKYKYYTKDSVKLSNGYWSDFSVDVKYQTSFWCNKISIGFEITGGRPGTVTIKLLADDGVTWSSAISATVDSYGRVDLYRTTTGNISGAGTWTSTKPAYTDSYWNAGSDTISNATIIMGVRVISINNDGPVNLIEVKPSLVSDITHRLMTWSWDATFSEEDSFHPIGTVSSNSGSINFFNSDESGDNLNMVMSKSNRSANQCRISEFSRQYCEIKSYITVTPGNSVDIPNFSAFASSWTDGSDNKITAELTDLIGILQEMDAPEMMIEKASVSQVLWRVFDLAGVGPIKIKKSYSEIPNASNYVSEDIVKVAWTEKDQNLWGFVKSICSNFRYAVYVDERGYINIATRNYIFDNSRSIDWTFYGQDSGTGPFADIINFQPEDGDTLNTVTFKYSPIQSVSSDPNPSQQRGDAVAAKVERTTKRLWSPEKNDILLGRATLYQSLRAGDTDYIWVYNGVYTEQPMATWDQYSGYVLIDREIIKFEGQQFVFKDAITGDTAYQNVSNIEEFEEIKSRALGDVTFTGKLMGLTRGQFGTIDASHTPAISTVESKITKARVDGSDIVYETKNLFSIGDYVTITNITGFTANSKQVTAISSHKEVNITKAVNTDQSTNKYYSLNNLSVGDTVTITGFSSSIFNKTNVKVLSATKTIFTTAGDTKGNAGKENGKAVKTGYFKISNTGIGASGSANGTSSSKAYRASLWTSTYASPYTYSGKESLKNNACMRVRNANGTAGSIYKSYRKLKRSDYDTFYCNIRMATGNSGGMAIWSDNGSRGLFVQLSSSTDATKKNIHELSVFVKDSHGTHKLGVAEARFYPNKAANLYVLVQSVSSTEYRARISFNGKKILTVRFLKGRIAESQKSGLALFSVGKSVVDFDYVGANKSTHAKTKFADVVSEILSVNSKPNQSLGQEQYYFDNSVRSIYYEDVKFDKGPARSVFFIPYMNYDIKRDRGDKVDPAVAKAGDVAFAISNQSPWHARIFLVGLSESPVLLGSGQTKYPLIYGEVYDRGQEQLVKKEDTSSIQRVGIKKFDGDLSWASDRPTVERIAKNLLNISSNGSVFIKIDSFSNHLISIGDCVNINYINRGHEEFETFIVIGKESSWDQGLKNTIKVVRQIGV